MSASDCDAAKRTWQFVMTEIAGTKTGDTQKRYERAALDEAFNLIRDLPLLETRAEHFLKVIRVGTVSTNVYHLSRMCVALVVKNHEPVCWNRERILNFFCT